METKTVCVGLNCEGAAAGAGRAIFARFDTPDGDGDVTRRGCFGRQAVKLVPAHNDKVANIGAAAVSETTEGAVADFQFYLAMPSALEWYESLRGNMKFGIKQEWSYAYTVLASSRGTFEGKSVRFLERVIVHEVSPVLLGSQSATELIALKACSGCGESKSACACHGNGHATANGNGDDVDKDWRDRDRKLQLALAGVTDPLKRYQIRQAHKDLVRPAMSEQEAAQAIEKMHWQFLGSQVRETLRLAETRLNGHARY